MSSTPLKIHAKINGQLKELDPGKSLADLLASLSIPKEKVVIERNLEIVPKNKLDETVIQDQDEIEIVHFVGGGAKGAESLVIVESPAKCKTIQKYLGPKYELAASMGHVVDLPKSKMGIDVDNNFTPHYIVTKDRKKTFAELKKKAKGKKNLFLACDPDREGEAISWHLKNELGKGKQVYRVVFNEITKDAILEAFKHPHDINMNLVDAQQARRVLDRLVGYSLSPILWQKVSRGLSAGRVQSVALRLIVDREREIRAFTPEEYWTLEADLRKKKGDKQIFHAKLEKIKNEKAEIRRGEEAADAKDKIGSQPFIVEDIKRLKKKRNPGPPFTTSKLQQAAYNALRFPAAKTMKVAQTLYEGVEIGQEGSVGLITYMRTDSVKISDQAIREIREYVEKKHGKEYLPATPNVYKAKKQAQEAHEAIRPASIGRHPDDLLGYLTPDQAKLYKLIWEQAVSSQMSPAQLAQETADIAAGDYLFRASGSRVEFPGFLIVTDRSEEDDHPLPVLEPKEVLDLVTLESLQHFTKPPARFTDASLVKALEERGIGRPSTYAPIIMTLTSRDYIRRDGGSLTPTELGILVVDLLVKHFEKIMDFEFTATMEEGLDKVEEGEAQWVEVVREFYSAFRGQIESAKTDMQTVRRESEPTDEICDKCGKPMVIKWGRRGKFMSCSAWPECKNAKSISTSVLCPQCGTGKLVQRRAKSGRGRFFYGCTQYPACTFLANKLPSSKEAPGAPEEGSAPDEGQSA